MFAIIFALLLCCFSTASSAAVVVMGSEISAQFSKSVAQEYMQKNPGKIINVYGGGKDSAIIALSAGSCDIANSSLSLAEQDRPDVLAAIQAAKDAGTPFIEIAVAIDGIDFFVNKDNPVSALTFEQLQNIYLGNATNWGFAGGHNAKIAALYTGEDDAKNFAMKRWLLQGKPVSSLVELVDKKLTFSTTANQTDAIGYDGIFYANESMIASPDRVKRVPIQGPISDIPLAPSRKYPVSRKLYFFVRQGAISKDAQDFINFFVGPEGQRVVGKFVSPVMPPAKMFELSFSPNGKEEQTVGFSETLDRDVVLSFSYHDAPSFTFLAKNNTYHDASFPIIESTSGEVRPITNKGVFMTLSPLEPTGTNKLANCNVSEFTVPGGEKGLMASDKLTFHYNGQKITVLFQKQENSDSGSCNALNISSLVVLLAPGFFAIIRKKR